MISFAIMYFGALFYPHIALGGGVLLEGKTAIEILLFFSFVLYAISRLSEKKPLLESSPLSTPIFTLTALVFLTSFFAQNKPIALEAIFLYLAYICCFFICLSSLNQTNKQIRLTYTIILISLLLSSWGLIQYYYNNLDPNLKTVLRLRATFSNSNQMAGFLSMTIPLCLSLILSKKRFGKNILGIYLTLFTMIVALSFTYARGAWIATAVGICFIIVSQLFFQKNTLKKIISHCLPVILLPVIFFLSNTNLISRFNTLTQGDTEVTLYGRQLAWKGTIEMIKANAITGVGPGNYSKAFRTFQPPGLSKSYVFAHNDYLHFISETGVLLIPILFWLFYSLFKRCLQKTNNTNSQIRGITLGAMGGIIALLVYSVSDFNLHIPANALLFTILTAIVTAPVFEEKNYCT